jgi:hypothetical protein
LLHRFLLISIWFAKVHAGQARRVQNALPSYRFATEFLNEMLLAMRRIFP